MSINRDKFIKEVYCQTYELACKYGIPHDFIMGQVIQETGWGKHILKDTNNIFNIKANKAWKGEKLSFHVWEVVRGKKIWVDSYFRKYSSYKESVNDWLKFLKTNPRYKALFEEKNLSTEEFAKRIQKAGYATDPKYAENIVKIVNGRTYKRLVPQHSQKKSYLKLNNIPNFAYPFKRRSNTATKTKSDQEIFEEILFKDKTAQYLFNSSGLFHGGVHLKAEEFEMDFEVESIRAIADGELVYYRIDKEYLKNKLEDTFGEFEVLYSTGFFLLEHKMEYPKGNRLKFYSLYMHTAPSYEYEFEEYTIVGSSAYARKTSDNSKADDFVKLGDKVILGKPIANKDGRYELLTVNGIKMPSGYNVHISNLQYEAVVTTVTGSKPNMRKGNKNTSPSEGLLKDKSSITVHPYQTEEQKKYKRYKVLKAIKADGTPAVVSSKSTIHASNIKAKIPEVHIYTKKNNGIVQPHMKEMAGSNLKPASLNFKVKAGEELGKLGVYNSEWSETELDKMVHLEVFTFDDLKGFIEKAQEAYKKDPKDLSDEEKKLRPKENLFVVPKDEKELFILDDAIYGVTTKNTSIREGMVKTDTNFYKLAPSGTELELSNNKNTKRQQIKEWVGETLDENKIYSVHIAHVDFYKKFIPVPQESEVLTKSIRKSPSKLKILKDKDKNEYVCIDENIRLYVKKKKEYFTHGITFSNFTLIDEAGADKIGIFEDISKYYEKKTEEDATPQQDKEKLNDTFKAILQKIQIDKNKDGKLEAGEFASLSLTKEKRKELSYMMVKHKSEWEYQKEKFQPILDYMKNHNQNDRKKMFEDRLEKLALFPKDLVGQGKTPTFIHPIALVEGFVGGEAVSSCMDEKISKWCAEKKENK